MIDVPVDAGGDGVIDTMSSKTLCIDTRSDLVIVSLAAESIVLAAGVVIDGLVRGIIGVGVGILTESDIVPNIAEVIAVAVASGFCLAVSCDVDVRAGVWTGTPIAADVTIGMRVDTVVGVLRDLSTDTILVILPGIGVDALARVDANMLAAAMADLDFICMQVPVIEDPSRFC